MLLLARITSNKSGITNYMFKCIFISLLAVWLQNNLKRLPSLSHQPEPFLSLTQLEPMSNHIFNIQFSSSQIP